MIKVEFNPDDIAGSLQLRVEDLTNPAGIAVKLREAVHPFSKQLLEALSAATKHQLQQYDATQPLPDNLRDALISELNQLLPESLVYDERHFRGIVWKKDREKLMPALIRRAADLSKHVETLKEEDPKKAEGLTSLNRLLLEGIYPDDIVNSLKAEWHAWNLLANEAKLRVIEQREAWRDQNAEWKKTKQGKPPEFKPVFDEDVWKGFRDWLKKNVFNNKCAYCETTITGFPGDTEHFRPKGRVRIILEDGGSQIVKIVDEDGDEIEHPGYFWLAYHWRNLLPSCQFCNAAGGKSDLFPIAQEKLHVAVKRLTTNEVENLAERITQSPKAADVFYLEPGDLDRLEGRLLLHPYYDKPEEHIYFELDGTAAAWNESERGKRSIEIFNLNETSKLAARRTAQDVARRLYFLQIGAADDQEGELKKVAQKFMDDYYRGTKPYAAAVFDFIHFKLGKTIYDPAMLLGERRQSN